jgi:FkbH-like protein
MVTTIPLTTSPENFVELLWRDGLFDQLTLTTEDRMRGELYHQRYQAESLRKGFVSVEEFCRDLKQVIHLSPVDPQSAQRAAQLTQKTNQFNATTLRYQEPVILERMQDPAWVLTTASVSDRFGDNGIVGFTMARGQEDTLAIDTFLLSCRVIGRTVETAMLAHLCHHAKKLGLRFVRGIIIPTPKNPPVSDLFQRHGFFLLSQESNGTAEWLMDLKEASVQYPDWLTIQLIENI